MEKDSRAETAAVQPGGCVLHDTMRRDISEILRTVKEVDKTLRGEGQQIGLVGQVSHLVAHDRIMFPDTERGQSIMSRMQFVETVTKVCVWVAGIICAFIITAVATQYVVMMQKSGVHTTGIVQAP